MGVNRNRGPTVCSTGVSVLIRYASQWTTESIIVCMTLYVHMLASGSNVSIKWDTGTNYFKKRRGTLGQTFVNARVVDLWLGF